MKRLISALMVGLLLGALSGTAALAGDDNNGQAIGKDPARLLLTQCSNAGIGNGGEYEAGILIKVLEDDCLQTGKKFSVDELEAIFEQSEWCFPLFPFVYVCEIDPGNSAQNNNAEGSNGDPQSEAAN